MAAGSAEKTGQVRGKAFYLVLAAALLAITAMLLVYSFREYYSGTGARVEDFPVPPHETDAAAAQRVTEGAFRGGPARTAYFPYWDGGDHAPALAWQTDNYNPEGIITSPVVADGILYMVTSIDYNEFEELKDSGDVSVRFFDERIPADEAVVLEAYDTETGELQWIYLLGGDHGSGRAGPVPTVEGGMIYTGTGDSGCLLAVDAASVREEWRFCMPRPQGGGFFPMEESPVVADGLVFAGAGDGNLYALDAATGAERWRFHAEAPIMAAPASYGGIVYFGTSGDGEDPNLYAVDQASGREVWRFHTAGSVAATAAVADGIVYFQSTDSNLYAVDAASGDLVWRFDVGYAGYSSPVLARGRVFTNRFSDENGHAWVDALDARDGSVQWEVDLKRNFTSELAAAGGSLLVESGGQTFSLDVRNGKEQWQQKLSLGGSSATVFENRLYVGGLQVSVFVPQA